MFFGAPGEIGLRLRRCPVNRFAIDRTQPCGLLSSNSTGRQKRKGPIKGALQFLARPERFELPTARFVAGYSIQLSYGRIFSITNSVAEREGFEPSKGF